jgi:hypothetical protein
VIAKVGSERKLLRGETVLYIILRVDLIASQWKTTASKIAPTSRTFSYG